VRPEVAAAQPARPAAAVQPTRVRAERPRARKHARRARALPAAAESTTTVNEGRIVDPFAQEE
jgi:hypothetical protein